MVAILLWGLLIEDFLEANHLSLDEFCEDFTGSWVFGYADALRTRNIQTIIVAVSSSVTTVASRRHEATGAEILLLPPTRFYRFLRRRIVSPHGRTVRSTFRLPRAIELGLLPLLYAAKELAPYLSMRLRALARELDRRHCRVLLCQEYEYPRFDVCVAVGHLTGVRVYGVFQGGDYRRWDLERLTRAPAVRHADGLIVASGEEAERVRRAYRPRALAVIANPIDLEVWRPHDRTATRQELGIDSAAPVAAWHGRIELRKKGLDTLLDSWSLVSIQRPDAKLVLIGAGGDANVLRQMLDEREFENVVWISQFIHDRRRLARLLGCADVYVFTSRHEGFPVAPIEAMACGLPVVATAVSGIREVLGRSEAGGGVVVPVDDDRAFAGEVLRLFADETMRRRLATNARASAERFGLDAVGEEICEFVGIRTSRAMS